MGNYYSMKSEVDNAINECYYAHIKSDSSRDETLKDATIMKCNRAKKLLEEFRTKYNE